MGKERILLVDDDPDILELIRYNLEKEEYEVAIANSGMKAIELADSFVPHLILLDVMMPEMDGIETCSKLRETAIGKTAIIAFLTARGEDYSQIAGLDAGGDDYISKPVKPRVLVSRIKALLRRSVNSDSSPIEPIVPITADRDRFLVICHGTEISLPKKEFELVELLLSNPGKVFTRNEILSRVWGQDVVVGDRTVDVHIRKVREKLGESYIVTVKGVGYKINF